MKKFSPIQRAAIQARSGCDVATIKKYPHVREASSMRIERACSELGIALPVPSTPPQAA
jgi:hypothetical protein